MESVIQSNICEVCDIVGDIDTADIYMHTLDDNIIQELIEKGYDVEIGAFILATEYFEVRISCKKKEKGNYSNPIESFYKLVDEGRIDVVEKKEGIYITVPSGQNYFFECYEDLFNQSACSQVKRLIDQVLK